MKKSISIILALALGFSASAQTSLDGLIFSEKNYVGTARTLAMGNAFTALGGDVGALEINPASSAVSKYFLATVSLGTNTSISVAQGTTLPGDDTPYGYGDRLRSSGTKVNLPNIGTTVVYDTHRNSGVKRVSLGIAVNSTNRIYDKVFAGGNHYGTSFAGYLAANTYAPYKGLAATDAYDLGYYAWDAILGVQSGMIANLQGKDNEYVGITEKYTVSQDGSANIFTAGPLTQDFGRFVDGSKTETVINVALDINDWIYVGANLGFSSLRYAQQYYIRETAVDPEDFDVNFEDKGAVTSTNFKSLKYNYSYDAKGSGIYGKIGIIMTPGKHLRIGATVQTPTSTSILEHWQVGGETVFENDRFNSSSTSPRGDQKYFLSEPWRASLGVASTFGKLAIVSADYEAAFFGSMKFRATEEHLTYTYFGDTNQDIRETMGIQHNLRVGAEVKPLDWLSVRGGYNLLSSPYKGDLSLKHSASFGLGFNSGGMIYGDIAARGLFYPVEYIKPYGDYIFDGDNVAVPSPEIRHWSALVTAVATLGFRF